MKLLLLFTGLVLATGGLSLQGCKNAKEGKWSACIQCIKSAFSADQPHSGPAIGYVDGFPLSQKYSKAVFDQLPSDFRSKIVIDDTQKKAFIEMLVRPLVMMRLAQRSGLESDPDVQFKIERSRIALLGMAYSDTVRNRDAILKEEILLKHSKNPEFSISRITLPTQREAENIHALLKKGKRFEDLARQFSSDPPAAAKNGYLGFIWFEYPKNDYEKALHKLKDGHVSGVLQKDAQFVIVRREKTNKTGTPSPATSEIIKRAVQVDRINAAIDQAEASMKIEVDDKALEALLRSNSQPIPN